MVSLFEVDDVLPFSKHMKINLGSLTHCISQPIKHRSQANCARTNQKTATCKVQGLSANGGDKKKITRRSLNVAVSRVQVCTQTQTTIFSGFYAALSNAFIPIRRIFIKKTPFIFKKWSSTIFWSYYCTKCKKSVLFVGFMTVITQDVIQISPRRGRS